MLAAIKFPFIQSNGGWGGALVPTTVIEKTYTLRERIAVDDDLKAR